MICLLSTHMHTYFMHHAHYMKSTHYMHIAYMKHTTHTIPTNSQYAYPTYIHTRFPIHVLEYCSQHEACTQKAPRTDQRHTQNIHTRHTICQTHHIYTTHRAQCATYTCTYHLHIRHSPYHTHTSLVERSSSLRETWEKNKLQLEIDTQTPMALETQVSSQLTGPWVAAEF